MTKNDLWFVQSKLSFIISSTSLNLNNTVFRKYLPKNSQVRYKSSNENWKALEQRKQFQISSKNNILIQLFLTILPLYFIR